MKKKIGVLFLFLAVVTLVGGSRLLRLEDPDAITASPDEAIYLEEPIKLDQLSSILVDSLGVVNDETELRWAAHILGWRTFQPGHYALDKSYTYDELLSKMARGIQDPVTITIVPGQSADSIARFLSQKLRFDSLAIQNVFTDTAYLADKNITPKALIGHLFPATYDLYWTLPPKKVMNRIFEEFNQQVVEQYRDRANELDKSMNEILTLASIIEWEAAQTDEKPKISGLYWNRLNRGMLLQADPTVNFAVDNRRRLYFKDYKVDSPYNTYIHKGLPPGPITNPSLSSIEAALFPTEHDYLFMVATPSGYHEFTRTYAEHQQKSAQWRDYLQEQERIGNGQNGS